MKNKGKSVLIIGAGSGLSASLARLFSKQNMKIVLSSRNINKLNNLKSEINAETIKCDSSCIEEVYNLFQKTDQIIGIPDLVIYNPSARIRGNISELNPTDTQKAINVTCFGAFLVAQQSANRMIKKGRGAIFFTGASASVKGFANSSVFAMGKFALRGLAQSLARELHPKNIHIGHFVIDGGIGINEDKSLLNPDHIAKSYLDFYNQDKSIWSWEIHLRPWVESF
tara:strand:- start:22 stop:699 length:678 start_codon:yes stop_codon:yes gene_type:complete